LITKLLLHTLDGGFGSGQIKNAAESSDLLLVCDGCGADMVGLDLDWNFITSSDLDLKDLDIS